jgi:hypothetical protein
MPLCAHKQLLHQHNVSLQVAARLPDCSCKRLPLETQQYSLCSAHTLSQVS